MLLRPPISNRTDPPLPYTTLFRSDGTGDGLADAALGHPRVWLEIDPDDGYADCGYCDRHFILIGGIADKGWAPAESPTARSEEHTSELQSLMRTSYAVFCLKNKPRSTDQ